MNKIYILVNRERESIVQDVYYIDAEDAYKIADIVNKTNKDLGLKNRLVVKELMPVEGKLEEV